MLYFVRDFIFCNLIIFQDILIIAQAVLVYGVENNNII